jgi:hypothetical protein
LCRSGSRFNDLPVSILPGPNLGFHRSAIAFILVWYHGVFHLFLPRHNEELLHNPKRFDQQILGDARINHLKIAALLLVVADAWLEIYYSSSRNLPLSFVGTVNLRKINSEIQNVKLAAPFSAVAVEFDSRKIMGSERNDGSTVEELALQHNSF